MSLDAERALAAALLARLRADPAVQAALGAPPRIYDQPPAEPVHPYLVLGRTTSRPFGGGDGEGAPGEGLEVEATLTSVSRFGGAEEGKAITTAVRGCLHDAPLPLEGARLVNLRVTFADVLRASDWRSTYGVLRLRAVVEPEPQAAETVTEGEG